MLVDGVASASVLGPAPVTKTWDMRDRFGNLIEEGYYLVYVQLHAERIPQTLEQDTVVDGMVRVGIETCWDDPHYDTLGQHRVAGLFHFKDSAFTHVEAREKKWAGDPYDYMDGPMTIRYEIPSVVERFRGQSPAFQVFPNPSGAGAIFRAPEGQTVEGALIRDPKGGMIRALAGPAGAAGHQEWRWDGRDGARRLMPAGSYFVEFRGRGWVARRVLIHLP
jgi:hypothetical protein